MEEREDDEDVVEMTVFKIHVDPNNIEATHAAFNAAMDQLGDDIPDEEKVRLSERMADELWLAMGREHLKKVGCAKFLAILLAKLLREEDKLMPAEAAMEALRMLSTSYEQFEAAVARAVHSFVPEHLRERVYDMIRDAWMAELADIESGKAAVQDLVAEVEHGPKEGDS